MSYDPFDQSLIQDPKEQRHFEKLKAKLLAIGGNEVVARRSLHLDIILKRGRFMNASLSRKVKSVPNTGHFNAVIRYIEHYLRPATMRDRSRDRCQIGSGYALSSEGLWYQHYWLVKNYAILETGPKPRAYFGTILTPGEAFALTLDFVHEFLPGSEEYLEIGDDLMEPCRQ